jgi:fibronectin type 3 domain-containing protein
MEAMPMSLDFIKRLKSIDAKIFWLLATVVLFAAAARATNVDVQWDNGAGNNDWGNATNWSGNVLPGTGLGTTGDKIHINLSGAGRAIYSTATGDNTYQFIRIGDSASGELLVTGGSLGSDSTTVSYIGQGGNTGTVTVTNGSLALGGYMEVGLNSGSTGNINVSGGLLDSSRNGTIGGVPNVSIGFGDGTGTHGNCVLSGGELRTRTGILLGANGGTGRFEVDGAGVANVGTDNAADDGFWVQNSGSTLAAYVTNGTLGSIYVAHLSGPAGTYSSGNVMFMPGSLLEVGFLGATNPGAWNLMTWDGTLLTNGLAFAPGTDTNWSFAFVTNNGASHANTLRIIYIAANLSPPMGIVAVPGNSQVMLHWSAAAGATNYFLKRATSSGGPYTFTNSLADINYTDTGLTNGVTYYYVVSAAMTNGLTGNSFEVRATPFGGNFVHPGVMHTVADLERMRTNVLAANNPWYMGYTNMLADSHSSSSYAMEGPLTTIHRDAIVPALPTEFQDDCGGAYQNALLWYLTGDPAHAAKAIQILDAWSSICTNTSGSDVRLACGLQGFKFITAAEIIRYTGAPWSQAEINTCSNFIRNVILPQNRMYGGGNWGQCGAASAMAAGVFLDDEGVFNEAMNAMKFGAPTECDMGVMDYINPGGWTDESDRDIGHWGLGLDDICQGYWTAWCQGIDMWTFLNNRLLVGHEYLAYFNANNTTNNGLSGLTNVLVPYVAGFQCDGPANTGLITQTAGALAQVGTWFPLWEQAFNPYQNMIGLAAPWSSNAVAQIRPEGYDRDHIAFGTLVAALPPLTAGLPVMPSGLGATWSNAQVSLVWNAASDATGYNVKRATSRGGDYINIASIAVTSYTDNTVSNDVLYFYKVSATNSVGETVNSGLATAYPSAAAPAAPSGVIASTISHVRIDLAWNSVLGATNYIVKRSTASGGPYATIANGVGTTFLTYADTGLMPNTTYYYVVSATNNIGASADSAQVIATTLPALPASWTYSDGGYVTTPGNATYTNGAFTVQGAGLDYGGGAADAFGFSYLNMTGDGTIIARYTSRSIYSGLNKAGLSMRESLAEGSKHVFLLFDGTSTNGFIYRTSTGGNGTSTGSTNSGGKLPEWLKLTRAGNVFTGSVSTNGTNWVVVNSHTITMNSTILVGFAVCSRNNGALDTAVFDNVSVTGLWPALPGTPTDLIAVPGDTSVFLNWSAATNATGYNLKSANVSGGPYTTVATNWSSLIFTNTGLVNGTPYYYVVSGTNFFGESANSSEISVRPVSFAAPQLAFQTGGNQIQFTWPSDHFGWELQVQTNSPGNGLGTNWMTVPGSSGTNQMGVPVDSENGSVFYRLIYP